MAVGLIYVGMHRLCRRQLLPADVGEGQPNSLAQRASEAGLRSESAQIRGPTYWPKAALVWVKCGVWAALDIARKVRSLSFESRPTCMEPLS